MSLAKLIPTTPALHPIPPKLNVSMSSRRPKWLTTMADMDGMGQKVEQFTTSTPISRAATPVLAKTSATALKTDCCVSRMHVAWVRSVGSACIDSGTYVSGPNPEFVKIFL
jgi:hypothetical protein